MQGKTSSVKKNIFFLCVIEIAGLRTADSGLRHCHHFSKMVGSMISLFST